MRVRDLKCEMSHILQKYKNKDGNKKHASLRVVSSSGEMQWKGIRESSNSASNVFVLFYFLFFLKRENFK